MSHQLHEAIGCAPRALKPETTATDDMHQEVIFSLDAPDRAAPLPTLRSAVTPSSQRKCNFSPSSLAIHRSQWRTTQPLWTRVSTRPQRLLTPPDGAMEIIDLSPRPHGLPAAPGRPSATTPQRSPKQVEEAQRFAMVLQAQGFFEPTPQRMAFSALEDFCAADERVTLLRVPEGTCIVPPDDRVDAVEFTPCERARGRRAGDGGDGGALAAACARVEGRARDRGRCGPP